MELYCHNFDMFCLIGPYIFYTKVLNTIRLNWIWFYYKQPSFKYKFLLNKTKLLKLDGEPSISVCMLMGTCLLIFVWETASWNIEGFLLALVYFAWSGTFVSHGTEQALLRFRSSILKENVGKILKYFNLWKEVYTVYLALWVGLEAQGFTLITNYYLITYCYGVVRHWARS